MKKINKKGLFLSVMYLVAIFIYITENERINSFVSLVIQLILAGIVFLVYRKETLSWKEAFDKRWFRIVVYFFLGVTIIATILISIIASLEA